MAAHYKIIISDRARHMLGIHMQFLANANPAAARKANAGILKAIRSLSSLPDRFPFLDAAQIPPNKYHKMYVESRYLVLYQIKDTTVYVEYVLDCRQEYTWLVK